MMTMMFMFCLLALAAAASDVDPDRSMANLGDPIPNIVGGSTASEGQFPWQLRLYRDGNFWCGAVLISSTRALTAAHCLIDGTYTAVGGQIDTSNSSGHGVIRTASSWNKYPGYTPDPGYPNDIGILKFDTPFPNNTYVSTINLPSNYNFTGFTCAVSGWGSQNAGDLAPSETLQHASMLAISTSECAFRFEGVDGAAINQEHICGFTPGTSTCAGDAGGPMVCHHMLAGITSWGSPDCNGNYPSVHTRVNSFIDWINSHL